MRRLRHRVKIVWGSRNQEAQKPTEYGFPTKRELYAFLDGVEEACGWMDYEVVEGEEG